MVILYGIVWEARVEMLSKQLLEATASLLADNHLRKCEQQERFSAV